MAHMLRSPRLAPWGHYGSSGGYLGGVVVHFQQLTIAMSAGTRIANFSQPI